MEEKTEGSGLRNESGVDLYPNTVCSNLIHLWCKVSLATGRVTGREVKINKEVHQSQAAQDSVS